MHLYSAPELYRNVSMVPGGREQLRLHVFSARVKAFCDSSGARSAGGRLFQVVGPLTVKLHCSTTYRMCGTSRLRLDAERKFCRPDIAVADMQRSLI